MGLETTKRGLMVNQKSMDITANNLSNIKTRGYTRQRLDTASVGSLGASRYPTNSTALAGQGVQAQGVAQIRNSFLDTRFREEYGDVGYFDQKAAILGEIEAAISDPEVEDTGIKNALKTLYSSLADFSANADKTTHANIVMTAFKGVTHALNQYDQKLVAIQEQEKKNLEIAVKDINAKLEQISSLNKSISEEIFINTNYSGSGYGPNELLDQRNVLIDDLSRYGDVRVQNKEDGSVQIQFNGKIVVDAIGSNYSKDSIQLEADGLSMNWTSDNSKVRMDTGALKGFTEVLTGDSAINRGIPYYRDKLDNLASSLTHAFNQVVPNDGAVNGDSQFKVLLQGDESGKVTAGNISISDEWSKDPSYILRPENPDGKVDNEFILAMKGLLDGDMEFDGEFKGTFSEYVTFFTSSLGSDITLNSGKLDSALSVTQSIDDDRMSVSGVSVNEEGINMMTYDKAFKALSRMMTVMDEQLDLIINRTGVVGR